MGAGRWTPPRADEVIALSGADADHDELLDAIGDRRIVLLGEASHGSADFYRERARLTRRLVAERGFDAVAVEADWPDSLRVHRYVMGRSDDADASAALEDFRRFPSWMWRNTDVVEFVEWLRRHNAGRVGPVGFFGLDLYSLVTSMHAVVEYLDAHDPAAASAARLRYSCFDHVRGEGAEYGHAVSLDLTVPCEDEVVAQLVDLRRRAGQLLGRDGRLAEDEYFYAEQNAQVVLQAERYYRMMYRGRTDSWNLRDRHMARTLVALDRHLCRGADDARIVVWAHNSHVGDARQTEMGRGGQLNLGELARRIWPGDTFVVGYTTHSGTVTAATEWGGPAERKRVRPALEGSYEDAFHRLPHDRFTWISDATPCWTHEQELLERAIGVIYRPETERVSHWFHACLPCQFDAVVHLDRTTAVEPLERTSTWDSGEAPETYPSGL